MIQRLLKGTDWDYAGIKFTDAQPMLVEREICNVREVEEDPNFLIVHVEDGPHPYKENGTKASADHYIEKKTIAGITFYTEKKVPMIQPVVKGKIIAQA